MDAPFHEPGLDQLVRPDPGVFLMGGEGELEDPARKDQGYYEK